MKAKVFSHEKLIGTADLQVGDESMGCVFGEFLPTDNYYNGIQEAVWDFLKANNPDYRKWYSLRINIQLDNGYFIFADGGFTFDDVPEQPNEPKRIDIAGLDRHVIEDFFLQDRPRPFVEEPWIEITIGQKITFEDELKKEIGTSSKRTSLLEFVKPKEDKHVLIDFEVSALCTDQRNDDVLFVVKKGKFDKKFAVVHLTWRDSMDSKKFPITQFYNDFDDFKSSRMYADKADWQN